MATPGTLPRRSLTATRPSIFSLRLLRRFELSEYRGLVQVAPSAQRILALLAISDGPLSRSFVAGALWPEGSDQRAAAALRTALWRIGAIGDVVRTDGVLISLSDGVAVDFHDLLERADRLVHDEIGIPRDDDVRRLRDAGELLPGWYDDWVLIERERLRQMHVLALEALCLRLSAQCRYASATEAGLAAVACEPLRESAHRALVVAHIAAGNPGEALRQYALCGELMGRHLQLRPSPRMAALVAPLLDGDSAVTPGR